jgi:hypothetical protein
VRCDKGADSRRYNQNRCQMDRNLGEGQINNNNGVWQGSYASELER